MAGRVEAPQGVEFDTHVYLTSDEGVEAVFSAKGAKRIPIAEDIERIIQSAINGVPDGLGNWRVMSRAEISEYKSRLEDDALGLDDEEDEF